MSTLGIQSRVVKLYENGQRQHTELSYRSTVFASQVAFLQEAASLTSSGYGLRYLDMMT